MTLDPRHNAVRPDLADIRLADRVFAPHYAAPIARVVMWPVALRQMRDGDVVCAHLPAGAAFELLDMLGDDAWGIAVAESLVGYVDAAALGDV